MGNLTDELLMAYVDGELDDNQCKKVEAALANDAVAQEKLAVFQATGRNLSDLYSQPINEPVPGHLVELIKKRGAVSGSGSMEVVATRAGTSLGRLLGWRGNLSGGIGSNPFGWGLAAAAGAVVLAVVAMNNDLVGPQTQQQDAKPTSIAMHEGTVLNGGEAHRALETAASGQPTAISPTTAGETFKSLFSFKDREGRYCRQYALSQKSGPSHAGVACRNGDGQWQVLVHAPVTGGQSGANSYETASGEQESSVEDTVDSLIDGDVLGLEQEAALIANDWRSSK